MTVQSRGDGVELLLVAGGGNIDKCRCEIEMRSQVLAVTTTLNLRMIDDKRHMDVVLVHVAALTLQTVLALHLTVIAGVDDDGVLHQSSLFEVVQEGQHVVILVLDGVEVVVAEGVPALFGGGRRSYPCLPLLIVLLVGSGTSGLVEGFVPRCRNRCRIRFLVDWVVRSWCCLACYVRSRCLVEIHDVVWVQEVHGEEETLAVAVQLLTLGLQPVDSMFGNGGILFVALPD